MIRTLAADHALLGNKLNSIAKRMKANAKAKEDRARFEENEQLNKQTLKAYHQHAEKMARKRNLTDERKSQIKTNWYRKRTDKVRNEEEREELRAKYDEQIQRLQQAAQEVFEMNQQMQQCDVTNIIHSAKIARMADAHANKAKRCMGELKSEAGKIKYERNSSKKVGIKNLSRTLGDSRAQPMVMVERDKDTLDGGKCGELTSNPRDIDAVVKRAWQAIHNGMQ